MRFGFQTILWGRELADPEEVFRIIAGAGFQGVELAQDRAHLPPAQRLMELLDRYRLDLIGVAGGNLEDKRKLMDELRPYWQGRVARGSAPKPYIYVENAESPGFEDAISQGDRLALHCHYPEVVAKSYALLSTHPGLLWLPDTAHLQIQYVDPVKSIKDYRRRLAAIHLGDWIPEYGRTSYRYAKGFVELGQGDLSAKIVETLALLDNWKYDDWVVTELVYSPTDPTTSLLKCATWLHEIGYLPRPPDPPDRSAMYMSVKDRASFLSVLEGAASFGNAAFHDDAAGYLQSFVPDSLVSIWSFEATREYYSVLAVYPDSAQFDDEEFRVGRHFSSIVRRARKPMLFELTLDEPAIGYVAEFGTVAHKHLVERHGRSKLLVLPIYNVYNAHQVRFLLHFLIPQDIGAAKIRELMRLGADFGRVSELYLTEQSVTATAEASRLASQQRGPLQFLKDIQHLIGRRIQCQGITIFLVQPPGDRMTVAATSGLSWASDLAKHEQIYRRGDGSLTGRMLTDPRPLLIRNTNAYRKAQGLATTGRSAEEVATRDTDACMFWPFYDRRRSLLGVVRARNKYNRKGELRPFSEDDMALVEAIMQPSIPDLELMLADERRRQALSRLFHELEQPLFSTRSALQMAQRELDRRGDRLLDQDYVGDALSWMEMANRLLKSFDFLNWDYKGLSPERVWVLPVKDIIAPAVTQVRALLAERGLSEKRISYGNEEQIKRYPRLFVDKNMFQQVIFNLLSNAIKYALPSAADFRVEIRAESETARSRIDFRDWGRGIAEEWKEAIFEEGTRGSAQDGAPESVES